MSNTNPNPEYQATQWVTKEGQPRKRHLLDCDYFTNPEKLRLAYEHEMALPTCQWCLDRMTAALQAVGQKV